MTTNLSLNRPLSREEIAEFGAELDAMRRDVMASVGESDATYIRRVQNFVRYSEIAGRGLLFAGYFPPAFVAGATLLGLSKIVDNMELGHNVMHGQYDWLNDPTLRGNKYEWDSACTGDAWRHSHNYMHHTYTNVVGKDRDLGYGALRLTDEEPWAPRYLANPVIALFLALFFQWGVALHDLEIDKVVWGDKSLAQLRAEARPMLKKWARQFGKDYVLFPVLAGPAFLPVILGNMTANLIRNVWAFTIIFCGHFTTDAETFSEESLENETRGDWYVRQLRGSSNIDGGKVFHFFSGNLSHQIEHHMFPDIPAVRYSELAPRVRELCARYGQNYNTGSLFSQFAGVCKRIVTHAVPPSLAFAN